MSVDSIQREEEARMIVAAKKGDLMAFNQLLKQFNPLIKGVVSSYYLKMGDRDDLMQEASIGFFKAVRDYDFEAEASFRTFVRLCIDRQLITAIKSATRKKHEMLTNSLSLDMPLATDASEDWTLLDIISAQKAYGSPEEALMEQEGESRLLKKLNERLTAFEKKVVVEYISGKSYQEIAKALSKTEKSIDNALQRIRKKASLP